MKPLEDIHYWKAGSSYICNNCGLQFEQQYCVRNKRTRKKYGTKQLMALWAWYNFKRHLQKCWEIPFAGSDSVPEQ